LSESRNKKGKKEQHTEKGKPGNRSLSSQPAKRRKGEDDGS